MQGPFHLQYFGLLANVGSLLLRSAGPSYSTSILLLSPAREPFFGKENAENFFENFFTIAPHSHKKPTKKALTFP